jgi:hypothetical protein
MRLFLVALVAARLAAGDLALDLLPANTKVVFGMRVPAIVESALFKDAGTGAQKLSEEWLKLVATTGFDPLHDIDEVLMASPADNEKAAALIVLRGRFDLARMGAGATRYHGVAMVAGGKGGNSVLALLDEATAVAGDAPAVRAAIDRRGHGAPLDAQLAEHVQMLRERFDIWGTGGSPNGFVAPTGNREELVSMDRFEFGVRLSQGFELRAEIHARSPKDAEKLAASMESLKAMLAMMNGREPAAPKIDVQVKDGTVRIALAISDDDLKKAIAAQRGMPTPTVTPKVAPTGGLPVIVSMETTAPAPASTSGGTSVFMLPGKK